MSCFSLITRYQNTKSGSYRLTAGSKLIGSNVPRHKRTLLCWLPVPILSHDPRTSAANIVKRKAPGMNSQAEQIRRWLADGNLYKKIICVLNKPLKMWGKPVPGNEPGTCGFSVFRVYSLMFVGFTTPNETCCTYQKIITIFRISAKPFTATVAVMRMNPHRISTKWATPCMCCPPFVTGYWGSIFSCRKCSVRSISGNN
jgi:hypothetical protein